MLPHLRTSGACLGTLRHHPWGTFGCVLYVNLALHLHITAAAEKTPWPTQLTVAAASWETWDLSAPAMFEGLRGVRDCATFLALVCNMLCVGASFNILDFGCMLACTLTCGTSRSQAHPGDYLALGLEAPTLQISLLL